MLLTRNFGPSGFWIFEEICVVRVEGIKRARCSSFRSPGSTWVAVPISSRVESRILSIRERALPCFPAAPSFPSLPVKVLKCAFLPSLLLLPPFPPLPASQVHTFAVAPVFATLEVECIKAMARQIGFRPDTASHSAP